MKEKLHPAYQKARIVCVCGAQFEVGSTKKEMRVDICSKCHPFYTGMQRTVETRGRADKFRRKYGLGK
ncbi:50S ribosomal protein L31 [Candidatus Desulforudis audaxviator]|uniref:Large ribosomal subunit protein bL31 n=1 Tax=Desulforudis audaxviator (strain MP104C) TaxID=477974 RepID=RL31_DESAP|nr:50S ribosomal protein L31 [Candidatus Desulforudis audaxviator]B1I6L4.1 RecName: Full=Large ribosomal subunit protein bL31; AltName: Full=50S ribosomal protein L31 [Candidatus Desulforudis audaxviator MP104C]ACA60643.1 ribosomal protein L31 [Candidatus Desulforudis audaxviator MP104C]AZK60726.1 LSU ribosomal protein L31p [Candidatus Desulforudis audaxviator]